MWPNVASAPASVSPVGVDARRRDRAAEPLLGVRKAVIQREPDELAGHLVCRHLESELAEHLSEDPMRDRLAVDEHTVAVEDHQVETTQCSRRRHG